MSVCESCAGHVHRAATPVGRVRTPEPQTVQAGQCSGAVRSQGGLAPSQWQGYACAWGAAQCEWAGAHAACGSAA